MLASRATAIGCSGTQRSAAARRAPRVPRGAGDRARRRARRARVRRAARPRGGNSPPAPPEPSCLPRAPPSPGLSGAEEPRRRCPAHRPRHRPPGLWDDADRYFRQSLELAETIGGGGYPDRLCGGEIPLNAQIICIVDVYDALTTTRSYRPAMTQAEALARMAESRSWWQDSVYEAFLQSVGA
ncbi:MAG: HD domain-containing phosphohydrolase [Gemmatimonadales bacterium]